MVMDILPQELQASDWLRFYTVYYEYLTKMYGKVSSLNRGEYNTRNYHIHMGMVGLWFH